MCSWTDTRWTWIIGLGAILAGNNAGLAGPFCVNQFGLSNCSEGQAQLTIADLDGDGELELLVSNIGSSGQDGVVFKKGDEDWIRELSIGFNDLLVGAPNAAYIKWDGVDVAPGGGLAQVVFGLQVTIVAGETVISWSQEPAGVTSHTVNVYNAGILVASVASSGPPTVTVVDDNVPPKTFKWDYSGTLPPKVNWELRNTQVVPYSIQDSDGNVTAVAGDEVQMIAHVAALPPSIDALRITGADVSSITIDHESVIMEDGTAVIYGLVNAPLGQAALQSNDDCDGELDHSAAPRLHVCNLGSSGADGVVMGEPLRVEYWVDWLDPEDPPGTLPNGAFMDLSASGMMPGAPVEQPLGSWRVTKIAPGAGQLPYELAVDFSPLGVSDYDLEVLDATNGTVLYSETDRTNPVVGTQDNWPLGGGSEIQGNVLVVARPESELRIDGGPTLTAAALEIRMIAHPPTLPQGISSMNIKAADIPSLTITGEQIELLGASIPTVSEWGVIAMSILLVTAGTLVFRQREALPR